MLEMRKIRKIHNGPHNLESNPMIPPALSLRQGSEPELGYGVILLMTFDESGHYYSPKIGEFGLLTQQYHGAE